jgi:hypothetical protein
MASLNLTDNWDERNHEECILRGKNKKENKRLNLESNTK